MGPGLIAGATLLAALILATDLSLPLGVAGGVPYVALVWLGWYGRGTREIVVLGVVSSLLTLVGYYYSPDGGTAWVVLTNRFLAFVAIWVTAVLLILVKRAAAKMAASQKRIVDLARFPDEDPSPVLRVGTDGAISYANQAAGQVAELFAGDGQDTLAGGLAKEVAQTLETGSPREVDFVAGDRILSIAITPVAGVSYVNLYGRDVTPRKKAEAALRKVNETLEKRVGDRTAKLEREIAARKQTENELEERIVELQYANVAIEEQSAKVVELAEDLAVAHDQAEVASRAKSDFLASMSHELRTPLNAIIGFSEIMNTESLGPIGSAKYREYAGDIHESGQHLLDLINDILDLSKIESGNEELHEEDVVVPVLTESVLRLVRQRADQNGVRVELIQPDHLPALHADARKLKQILANLLTNAIKFTKTGGRVTLKTWCHADSGYVFQVMDTGIGIAREDIPRALSQFGQINSSLGREQVGTGLGLPLTKAMVELHGGCFDLQSEIGVGTTVTVRFPADRTVDFPAEKTPHSAA